MSIMKHSIAGAALGAFSLALLGATDRAEAGVITLQMDLNSVVADANESFDGLNHTGEVALSADADASLNTVMIDGDMQPLSADLDQLDGTISLDAGQVAGGDLSISLTDGSMFVASLTPSSGEVDTQAGQGFQVGSALFAGAFENLVGGSSFGGVDVSAWDGAEPLQGAIQFFAYSPNSQGRDADSNLDVFVAVPAPGAVALPMGLALTAMRRRRRA